MRHLKSLLVYTLFALRLNPVSAKLPETEIGNLLKTTIREYVQQKLALSRDELLLEFPNVQDMIPETALFDEIKVLPNRRPVRKGVQLIRCGLFRDEQLSETLIINVRIRTFQTVVVSKKKAFRLAILKGEDLKFARLETTKINRQLFFSFEEIVGLRTTRLVNAGEVITGNLVEKRPVIARGNDVDIHFKKGVLVITAPGVARQDGKMGDEILVKCLENKKVFTAEVLDANTVLVQL